MDQVDLVEQVDLGQVEQVDLVDVVQAHTEVEPVDLVEQVDLDQVEQVDSEDVVLVDSLELVELEDMEEVLEVADLSSQLFHIATILIKEMDLIRIGEINTKIYTYIICLKYGSKSFR